MKKIILICCCLLFVLNSQAKEHVYGTKQNGNFIYNDVTQRVTFKGKIYTHIKAEATPEGFNMFCSFNNQFFMFEIYSTQYASYIVQYDSGSNEVNETSSNTKPSLYYEGLGNILAEDISSNIARNSEYYLDNAGVTNGNDRTRVMARVADATRLIRKGGVRASSAGSYSFNDPEFNHLKSSGEFKKNWGKTKKDDNYYNNLAFHVVDQAVKASGNSYLSEDDKARDDALLYSSAIKSLSSTSMNWLQVIKDEIIAYDVQ